MKFSENLKEEIGNMTLIGRLFILPFYMLFLINIYLILPITTSLLDTITDFTIKVIEQVKHVIYKKEK